MGRSVDVLESLRRNAARKSALDADREIMASAADEIDRQRATMDAAIRTLSDGRFPLQSRVNDAISILAH